MTSIEKLLKQSTVTGADVLKESKFYETPEPVQTDVPMINVALTGALDGGVIPGLTVLGGPSKHFKTSFALLMASAYLRQKEDSVLLFYDSEFGSPKSYFDTFNIDPLRVAHLPIKNIEELKNDIVGQLENLSPNDNVVIVIDSVGNLASKKEVDDALEGKSVADMTRAKALKSLFRMITPYLKINSIPLLAVNHTYSTMEMYSRQVHSGGTGIMYSADNAWIIGRRQEKDGKEIKGYHFIIDVEKSRYVKEKSRIPISVTWEGGVERFSGLLDVAVEGGYIEKGGGWYWIKTDGEPEKFRAGDALTQDFWDGMIANTDFPEYVKRRYQVVNEAPS